MMGKRTVMQESLFDEFEIKPFQRNPAKAAIHPAAFQCC